MKTFDEILVNFPSYVITGFTDEALAPYATIWRNNINNEWGMNVYHQIPDKTNGGYYNIARYFKIKPPQKWKEEYWMTHSAGQWYSGRYDRHVADVDEADFRGLNIKIIQQFEKSQI